MEPLLPEPEKRGERAPISPDSKEALSASESEISRPEALPSKSQGEKLEEEPEKAGEKTGKDSELAREEEVPALITSLQETMEQQDYASARRKVLEAHKLDPYLVNEALELAFKAKTEKQNEE